MELDACPLLIFINILPRPFSARSRSLTLADTREPETFELTTLTGMQIWERLENLAGAGAQSQVAASSTPAVEAPKAAA